MGIGGGSGSGKSTIVNEIIEKIGPEKISVLHHDAYYRHRPELTFEKRTNINIWTQCVLCTKNSLNPAGNTPISSSQEVDTIYKLFSCC